MIGTIPDIPDLGPSLESIQFSVRVTESHICMEEREDDILKKTPHAPGMI